MADAVDLSQAVEQVLARTHRRRWPAGGASPSGAAGCAEECAVCGADIPSARLAAVPGTSHCRHCADESERRHP